MKKIQVQRRLRKAVVPCDKLSNHMFNYTADEFKDIILNHEECECVEGQDRKGKEVTTPYYLSAAEEYADLSPLTAFDRELLYGIASAYEQGFKFLSFKMMLSAMTGDVKDKDLSKRLEAIKAAIKRLMTVIRIDLAPLLKAFPKYRKRHVGSAELISPILPCKILDIVEINGQRTFAVELLDESPLMTVAKLKQQLITYDLEPLAVPNQNNTEQVIVIKNYLLRRIKLIKRGLNSTMLFDTIYRECGLADADKWQKQNARKEILVTLNHFKAVGVIKDFKAERQGNAFRAIKIINAEPRRL